VLFLAPGEANYITGHTLPLNACSRPEGEVRDGRKRTHEIDEADVQR
jgi:hypothetical protein